MKAADIRQTFLAYFESKGHTIVPSSPVVDRSSSVTPCPRDGTPWAYPSYWSYSSSASDP